MSDQYYEKEDVLPDTPAQAIQNWEAQSNSLAHVVPEVAARLQETGTILGELYAKAEAAGDQRGMEIISASWSHIETIGNQTVQMDAARQAATEVIKTIDDERQRLAEELGGLEEAISEGNENHPMLEDYAAEIRRDEAEYTYEEAIGEAYEYVAESTYDHFHEILRLVTGCTWEQVTRFMEVLQGDVDLSPASTAKLKDFIETLTVKTD